MKIYKKAIVVATMEVPDDLTQEQIEKAESNLETDMYLDISNMQDGGGSDYKYRYGIYDIDETPDGSSELKKLE